jgi:hypothetical protein
MGNILRKLDLIILALVGAIALTVTLLDTFDLIKVRWLDIPVFTMLLLSAVALHLIFSYFFQEDFHRESVDLLRGLAREIPSQSVRLFADSAEMETYLGKRMLNAKDNICDLSWKNTISSGFAAGDRQLAHGYMDDCIAQASGRISYREIFIFNDKRRIDKLERRISENKDGYSCGYFRLDSPIPRLQFVTIDDDEVFFFASSHASPLLMIKSKEICRVFKSYFDAVWISARKIKDGPRVYKKELAYIRIQKKNLSA